MSNTLAYRPEIDGLCAHAVLAVLFIMRAFRAAMSVSMCFSSYQAISSRGAFFEKPKRSHLASVIFICAASAASSSLSPQRRHHTHRWRFYSDARRPFIPELSPRELAVRFTDTKGYFVSESSVYRLLKAHDLISSPAFIVMKAASEFRDKTTAINQMWQTDFTYFKIIGWGWVYLSTILDDFSRYIISWKLCTTMKTSDVTDTLNMALEASGCDQATVMHKPRLLSDNGASYISGELADYIKDNAMSHVRGAPYHPQTQGKIERWHQTLKNRILLENYFLPGDLELQIEAFVEHYNHERYHESLSNVTPADVYFGRAQSIIKRREKIKEKTIELRRLQYCKAVA